MMRQLRRADDGELPLAPSSLRRRLVAAGAVFGPKALRRFGRGTTSRPQFTNRTGTASLRLVL